ncbi:uncharacterized protein N7483_005598 [Penicillium malachiteum]|uniref:uncharacterized protein n=1 Tax=Penicillium malachiteum TaxID=1324776 RepID=UPI00254728C1|nr:uncharacterized protein N7483_005598 [Penicillium malachiteum]KAJ5731090.1 hypothetical protein N7483_005598 [Penicillium malachiteum]
MYFSYSITSGIKPEFIFPSTSDESTAYDYPDSLTCGCQIGDQSHKDKNWVISTAIFDLNKDDQGIRRFSTHLYPGSAPDGLATIIPVIDGNTMEMVDPESNTQITPVTESAEPDLLAQCHCGGVSFKIARPKAEFIANPESQVWLSPIYQNKWLACMDTCDDCRLVNGTHVIGWMFIPVSHLSPIPPTNLVIGSSKTYRSTTDVLRTFCDTCGATVLYSCQERAEIVDVAVGILRAPEGVMAENWVSWRAGRVAWLENGQRYHAGFSKALMEGLKLWGVKRGHPDEFIIP